MPDDLMRYDLLAQNALKGVVREALRIAATTGLPGDHHFYIAFNTRHPGVRLSEKIANRYPREMTIVLQHQFWNLAIHEDWFEVELSFDNVPEHLVIPFNAVKGFLDPAVQFGLQFDSAPAATRPREVEPARAAASESVTPAAAMHETGTETDSAPATDEAAKVVSLDKFRKK